MAGDQICNFYFPKPVLWAETLRSFAPFIHHEVVKLRLLNQERLADRQWYIRLRPPPVILNYLSVPFLQRFLANPVLSVDFKRSGKRILKGHNQSFFSVVINIFYHCHLLIN